jgi:hypothetical protein
MKHSPAFICQVYARRHGLRHWLWAALGILLLSGLIQLGHNHDAHKSQQSAHECVICQHSPLLDKVLPSAIAFVAVLLLLLPLLIPQVAAAQRLTFTQAQIRAPPAHLHR